MRKSAAIIAFLFSVGLVFSSCGKGGDSSSPSDSSANLPSESNATDTIWQTQTIDTATTAIPSQTPASDISSQAPQSTIPDICNSRYGYYQLDADEKAAYDQLVQGIQNFQSTITLKRELDSAAVKKIIDIIRTENAELYYLGQVEFSTNKTTQIVSYVTLTYLFTQTEVQQLNAAADERIREILSKIPNGADDVTKIKIFHDQIILNCTYNLDYRYAATPYGALVAGQALCEGYARSFAMLCNKAGIENLFAIGANQNEDHIWNMVHLDGNWYNIDLTWDDPPLDADGQPTPPYYIQYSYYLYRTGNAGPNLTVKENLYTLPETNSDFFNYFHYYGYYARSYEDAIDTLAKQLESALQTNRKFLRVQFSTDELYNQMSKRIADQTLELADPNLAPFNKVRVYWCYQDPILRVIQFEIVELRND